MPKYIATFIILGCMVVGMILTARERKDDGT